MRKLLAISAIASLSLLAASGSWAGVSGGDILIDGMDFDDDGMADIVTVATDNSRVKIQLMDGVTQKGAAGSVFTAGGIYTLRAIGDLDGDGKADLVFQGSNDLIRINLMDGVTQKAGGQGFLGTGGGTYTLAGIGDLNDDTMADLVLESDSLVRINLMDGINKLDDGPDQGQSFLSNADGDYRVAALADLDGVGGKDLVSNGSGLTRVQIIEGNVGGAKNFLSNGGGGRPVTAVGFADSNATEDIFSSAATFSRVDLMDGVNPVGNGTVSTGASNVYALKAVADVTGTGKVSILGDGGATTGQVRVSIIDGTTFVEHKYVSNGSGAYALGSTGDLDADDTSDIQLDGESLIRVDLMDAGQNVPSGDGGRGFLGNGDGAFDLF